MPISTSCPLSLKCVPSISREVNLTECASHHTLSTQPCVCTFHKQDTEPNWICLSPHPVHSAIRVYPPLAGNPTYLNVPLSTSCPLSRTCVPSISSEPNLPECASLHILSTQPCVCTFHKQDTEPNWICLSPHPVHSAICVYPPLAGNPTYLNVPLSTSCPLSRTCVPSISSEPNLPECASLHILPTQPQVCTLHKQWTQPTWMCLSPHPVRSAVRVYPP